MTESVLALSWAVGYSTLGRSLPVRSSRTLQQNPGAKLPPAGQSGRAKDAGDAGKKGQ